MLVIEEEPSAEELALIHAASVNGALGTVRIERYSAEEVEISTENSPSFLVMTDIYNPGWRCYVDGNPVEIRRAYGVVRAVYLERGSHKVVFRYEPDSFRIGIFASLVSAACVSLIFARDRVMKLARGKTTHRRSKITE
jgi:uncharacterized membrane protein YfhO